MFILDEVGYVPFQRSAAELLFTVISNSYEQQSIITTSNLEFGRWNEVFGDDRLTAALIDRLVHHAHVLVFTGESYRFFYLPSTPGGLGALFSGFWLALRTSWGLTRHYWVIAKWIGNLTAILFGSSYMRIVIHGRFSGLSTSLTSLPHDPNHLLYEQLLAVGVIVSVGIVLFLLLVSYLKPWGQRLPHGTRSPD